MEEKSRNTLDSAGTVGSDGSTREDGTALSEVSRSEDLLREKEELHDQLLRTQAEFENYRKRVNRERPEQRISSQAEVLKELLTALDACEEGLKSLPESPADAGLEAYRKGYELILGELRSLLSKFGASEIDAVGARFDPTIHEAFVREVSDEHEEGRILDEFRKGYRIQDRLLRPSQVKVAVQPARAGEGEE